MSADITAVTVPKLGLTMKEGTIAAWHVEPGSTVSVGQPLFDIETEKVTNECTAEGSGILRRQVAAAGTTLPVGSLVAVIAPSQVSDAAIEEFITRFTPEKQA
ncbi:putative dihydrolipoyllysine-residue acetyltransferase [Variovorax paradoxus B4]|uniref:Putative dihydrolipoyllysine-residue acetyltransferase n=1 Tax=Variovorax paradoxus B4 TaxID=1246301 RepID=T1XKZ3_VARPD|nr:biotin/lipoyl-containing protein [Variovorax paradoxus]AGU52974.1 putative dihydrolipoyllysine-residue acetyltransferase [Variovorax paradoxus B4]